MIPKLETCGARKLQTSTCLNDLRRQLLSNEKLCMYVQHTTFEKVLLVNTAKQLKEMLKGISQLQNWSFYGVPESAIVITED